MIKLYETNYKVVKLKFARQCKAVYKRVINVVTLAHEMRSEDYYIKLHFLETLNHKVL